MAKTYNKDKHFDLDYFRTKGLAFLIRLISAMSTTKK